MPFGPSVLFTRSPTAMAPTNAARRAFSPFSSVVPSSKIWVGLKDAYKTRWRLVASSENIRFSWIHKGGADHSGRYAVSLGLLET